MVTISNIQRFINGDFKNAVLSGRYVNNKLETRLSIPGSNGIKYNSISMYGCDLDKLRSNPKELCPTLLDSFLLNNHISGCNYRAFINHYLDKKCVVINGEKRTFTLAFEKNIDVLFPDLRKKVEANKFKTIIDKVSSLDSIKTLYLALRQECSFLNINYVVDYNALCLLDGSIPKEEKRLIKLLIKEFIIKNNLQDKVLYKEDFDKYKKIAFDYKSIMIEDIAIYNLYLEVVLELQEKEQGYQLKIERY
ncbi:MAG: hypothetical protein RSB71_01615 [Bacilli bacterium]